MTSGVQALGQSTVAAALAQLRAFDFFDADSDPYGEHDFGSFSVARGAGGVSTPTPALT